MGRINNPVVEVGTVSTGQDSGDIDYAVKIQRMNIIGKEDFIRIERTLQDVLTSCTFKATRERLKLPERPKLYCPDCRTEMVKTYVEWEDKSGWMGGWSCECKPSNGQQERRGD